MLLAFCEGDRLGLGDEDVSFGGGLGLGDSDTIFGDGLELGDKDVTFGDCESGRFEEVGKDDWLFGKVEVGIVGDGNKGEGGGGNKLRDVPDDDGETPEETVLVASVKGKLLSSKTTCLDKYTRPVVKSKQR